MFERSSQQNDKKNRGAEPFSNSKKNYKRVKTAIVAAYLFIVFFLFMYMLGVFDPFIAAKEETHDLPFAEDDPEKENNYQQVSTAKEPKYTVSPIPEELILTEAVYPEPVAADMSKNAYKESDAYRSWHEDYRNKAALSSEYRDSMVVYYQDVMEELLLSEKDNTVCSPLNIYIALAMLAETAGGESRQQILDTLHAENIEELRTKVHTLWEGSYVDTPTVKSILANSFWLRSGEDYNRDTLDQLSANYFASAFAGETGSEKMNRALQDWTANNTRGLLKEYTDGMMLSPGTVLALVSTIYYKAAWDDSFSGGRTSLEIFHGAKGDKEAEMMHRTRNMLVYRTDAFTGIGLDLLDSGEMHFFLPAEGRDVNTLLTDPDIWKALYWEGNENKSHMEVHLTLPKFRVKEKTDLISVLKEFGVTDVLDPSLSDFTPLKKDAENIALTEAEHAAMVEIDEDGVTGAAYTMLEMNEIAKKPEKEEELYLVFDRPFLFMITGGDGSVLFSGIIRNID